MKRLWPLDEVGFKGDRDYLAGTDLFNALVERTHAAGPVWLQFYKLLINKVEVMALEPTDELRGYAGSFIYHANGQKHRLVLRELATPPIRRTAYDEERVIENAILEGRHIRSATPTPYTFIERAVALNKHLMQRVISDDVKWLFGRLDLEVVPPVDVDSIEIRLLQNSGTRLTKSSIDVDGQDVGFLYFSGYRNHAGHNGGAAA